MAFHHCHKDPMPQSGLSPERVQARRQLYAACAVCFIFMAGEVVGKLGDTPPVRHSVLSQPPSTKSPWFPGWRSKEVKGREGLEGRSTEGDSSERACGMWAKALCELALNNHPVMKVKSIAMERLETIPVILPHERTQSLVGVPFPFHTSALVYCPFPRTWLYICPLQVGI